MHSEDHIEQLLKNLDNKQLCQFAWLCGLRALPYLSTTRAFAYWPEEEKQRHLYIIFYALDVSAQTAFSDRILTSDIMRASEAAYSTYRAASINTIAAQVAYIVGAAAYSGCHPITSARNAVRATGILDLEIILLKDIKAIKKNKLYDCNRDTSIYGELWDNFQEDLKAIGCFYWAEYYKNLFKNGFDKIDIEELKRRIGIPDQIKEQGAAVVVEYLENAKKQGYSNIRRETRLIILGSAGAGKTTLARRLNGDDSYPDLEDSTHGVDTTIKLDLKGVKTHLWDFGGQVIYHSSHRCFLSADCVYILVVNSRTEDNRDVSRINYWLDTIRIYSNNKAKIFIIFNESDNRKQNIDDYDSFMDEDSEYKELIHGFYGFNIGNDVTSVENVKKILAEYIESTGNQTFGKNDSLALEKIKAQFDQKKQILKANEIESILVASGIKKEKDKKRAIELFNILGVALRYNFMEHFVVDPYWISRGVYLVIDYLQKNNQKFINCNELDAVFVDERENYPMGKREHILDLMEHYKIGFRNKGGVRGLIVPCVASQFKPRGVNVKVEPDNLVTQVERDGHQEFPADFFYRYICANEDDIEQKGEMWSIWQTGMVLGGYLSSALVELKKNSLIEITVWGEGKKEYSKKLEALIDDLLKEYGFESYENEKKINEKTIKIITLILKAASVIKTFF